MTENEIKFQTLMETMRANRRSEELKEESNKISERSVAAEEVYKLASIQKIGADIEKTAAEINKINSDTNLNQTEKAKKISEIVKNYSSILFSAMDSVSKILSGSGKAMSGGAAIAKVLIG